MSTQSGPFRWKGVSNVSVRYIKSGEEITSFILSSQGKGKRYTLSHYKTVHSFISPDHINNGAFVGYDNFSDILHQMPENAEYPTHKSHMTDKERAYHEQL